MNSKSLQSELEVKYVVSKNCIFFVKNGKMRMQNYKIRQGRRSCSTSYSGGILFDGSPRDVKVRVRAFPRESHTKTIAKRVRVGPRTQVVLTMVKLFGIMI